MGGRGCGRGYGRECGCGGKVRRGRVVGGWVSAWALVARGWAWLGGDVRARKIARREAGC